MKFCKDCGHLTSTFRGSAWFEKEKEYHLLCEPSFMRIDVIFGEQRLCHYPRDARKDASLCGLDAKWFKPRNIEGA